MLEQQISFGVAGEIGRVAREGRVRDSDAGEGLVHEGAADTRRPVLHWCCSTCSRCQDQTDAGKSGTKGHGFSWATLAPR